MVYVFDFLNDSVKRFLWSEIFIVRVKAIIHRNAIIHELFYSLRKLRSFALLPVNHLLAIKYL